jgi:hypothetical protein
MSSGDLMSVRARFYAALLVFSGCGGSPAGTAPSGVTRADADLDSPAAMDAGQGSATDAPGGAPEASSVADTAGEDAGAAADAAPGGQVVQVEGTDALSCTVTGAFGHPIGSGPPSSVSYALEAGIDEELAVVRCDTGAAAFAVGVPAVRLTEKSTAIADLLAGTSLRRGTKLVLQAMERLPAEDASAQVMRGMASFVAAVDAVSPATRMLQLEIAASASTPSGPDIITLLVTQGQPVLVENVGPSGTMKSCSDAEAKKLASGASAVDGSVIGLTGCLVFDPLYAITDLNNPLFAPDSVPASFRSLVTESGVVAALVAALAAHRTYSVAQIAALVFNRLGYPAHSENDEGQVRSEVVSTDAFAAWVAVLARRFAPASGTASGDNSCGAGKAFVCHKNGTTMCVGGSTLQAHIAHGDPQRPCSECDDPKASPGTICAPGLSFFRGFRFHTGYNPSGGWEMDAAATKTAAVPAACVDSNPQTACPLAPTRVDSDGTTFTPGASGRYLLQLEFRDGHFQNFAWLIQSATGKYQRDAFFQRIKLALDPTAWSAINYANPLYDRCLDPMVTGGLYGAGCEGGIDQVVASAPYANATWRGLFPGMTMVDNAYVFPNPELVARQGLLLSSVGDWSALDALSAFALLKLITPGSVAIPLPTGTYALIDDPRLTLKDWDGRVAAWVSHP